MMYASAAKLETVTVTALRKSKPACCPAIHGNRRQFAYNLAQHLARIVRGWLFRFAELIWQFGEFDFNGQHILPWKIAVVDDGAHAVAITDCGLTSVTSARSTPSFTDWTAHAQLRLSKRTGT